MTRTTQVQAERTIVLQLLRDNHPEHQQRVALEQAVPDIAPLTVNDALAQLEAEGVVILNGEQVSASPCARHLHALGLMPSLDRSPLATPSAGGDT